MRSLPRKKQRKGIQKNSLRIRLLITYLIIASVLVMIALGSIFQLMYSFAESEFVSFCNHSLAQVQDNIDSQMLTMYEIARNMEIDTALFSNRIANDKKLLTTYNVINRYSLSINMVENFYLFYSSDIIPYILSRHTLINKNYFNQINAWVPLTLEDLDFFLDNTEKHGIFPLNTTTGRYLANSYLLAGDPGSKRVVVFLVNLNSIIHSVTRMFPDQLAYLRLSAPDGTLLFEKSNGIKSEFSFSSQSANMISMKIEVGINRPAIYKNIGAHGQRLVVYIGISVVLGLLLSVFLTKKIYKPIFLARNRIVHGKREPFQSENNYAEISDIENTYLRISSEKAQLTSMVDVQADALVAGHLDGLLSGRKLAPSDLQAFAGKEQKKGSMVLIHCALDHCRDFMNTYSLDERSAIEQEILREFSSLDDVCLRRITSQVSEGRQWVSLLYLQPGVGKRQVLMIIEQSKKHLLLEETVTVTLGSIFMDYANISQQYINLQRGFQLRFQIGWNALIDVENLSLPTYSKMAPQDPLALTNFCLAGERDGGEKELHKFINAFYEIENKIDFNQAYFSVLSIMNDIWKATGCLEVNMPDMDYAPETIEEAQEILRGVILSVCASVLDEKQAMRASIAVAAMDYLQTHYANPMLGVEEITTALNISNHFLNTCFKEKYGVSLHSALDDVRMEKSRLYLRDTQMLIKDIVLAAGYIDVNNYIRKFKRLEGVTPLQYRKIMTK